MQSIYLAQGNEDTRSLGVGQPLAARLGLTDGCRVHVRCGQARADDVTLRVRSQLGARKVLLSGGLERELSLPLPLRLHIKREADGSLRLGPIVAVLARATRSRTQRFMNQSPYFAALVRTGQRLAIPTYVMTPESIDWQANRVRAWSVRRTGWYRVYIPLPDVVYDRVQTRRLDLLPRTRAAKEQLARHPEIKMFNTGFLDKWQTHQALASALPQRLLPETRLLTSRQDLLDFTGRFRSVFVKPAGGSLGKGIYVIQRRGRFFRVIHYGDRRVRHMRLRTPLFVWRRLKRRRKRRRYVIQQGIPFVRYHGRRFDLRLLAQKGGDGQWLISAHYARVAPPGSLRANLDAGGKAVRTSRVLRHIFGARSRRVLQRVLAAGLAVAAAMEEAADGIVGELGIDIGVDRQGRPWVIEANAKPLRQMEGPRKRLRRTLRRPLQFAKHLAGF